jgi:endonuclease/exonuclease/phosphatase family metal-dependent hydrolase
MDSAIGGSEVTINKRTTAGQLYRESATLTSQCARAGYLFSVAYTCFLSFLMVTQFFSCVTWHFLDPAATTEWSAEAMFLAFVCFGATICCPCLLNNRFMENLFDEAFCLTLPSFALPTALMASMVPMPAARTVSLGVGVLLSALGFFSILCQPRTADRYVKTKLIFEVYRFAIPTSLVLLCTWRWANADIDPTLSERYWWIKMLFAMLGYLCAFVTGASYLVHDSRVTPAGMLADMAKDPLPDAEEYDSAADPMVSTSIAAFPWYENLLWLPAGVALGSSVYLSTFVFSSVAQVCRWNGVDPYEHGIYIILAVFGGSLVRLLLSIRMRSVDGLIHAIDCVATTGCLWTGLLLFAYMGGDMIGFWGVLVAVLAAASMWHHVLRLCEVRAVGAHGGLTLCVGGVSLLAFWFMSMTPVFGGAMPLGERYRPDVDGKCPTCEWTSMLSGIEPFVSVALATVGATLGPIQHAIGGGMRAVQQRAEDRKKRMKEAAKYVVDDSETDEKGAFALQLAEHNTLAAGGAIEVEPPQAAHVNAGPPLQQVVQSREAFGVLFAIFFIVIAPGIMSRVVAHNTLPELSPEEGEFISIISWNINYGWSSDGKMNIHDIAERVAQQQAGVVALQDANALQWPLGSNDLTGYLSTRLTMHLHNGLSTSTAGDTGNPLLSKYPLLLSRTIVLPSATPEATAEARASDGLDESCNLCASTQQTMTEARLLVGDVPVTVINTQLERVDGLIHRADTAARIEYIEKIANETKTPLIIVGGLGIEPNDPLLDRLIRSSTSIHTIDGMSEAVAGGKLNITVPASGRDLSKFDRTEVVESKTVDYMLYRGLMIVGFGYVIDDVDSAGRPVYEQPSDHLPLIGNFMVRQTEVPEQSAPVAPGG